MKLGFLERFSTNNQIFFFMKFRPAGCRVFPRGQTDGRTDMTKLIVSFRKCAKAPKYCFEGAGFVLGYTTIRKILLFIVLSCRPVRSVIVVNEIKISMPILQGIHLNINH